MKIVCCMILTLVVVLGSYAKEIPVITLNEALSLALESDERIEIQWQDVNIAAREVSRAWTIIAPRLEASARYERPEEEIRREEQVILPEDTLRGTITARQPIFDGRVLPARRLGLALEDAEWHGLIHTIRSSLFDVGRAYYQVLSAEKLVEIAEQTVHLAAQEVERARARFDAGEARRTEVLRTEVDEARAIRNRVAARNGYEVARSDLARRIGLPADYEFSVALPDLLPDPRSELLEELYLLAMQERDDLAAARKLIEAGREQRTVIRRESWPTLGLEYNHRFVDPESGASRNNFWDAAATARFEFWDGGNRRISRIQQEKRIVQAELRVSELEKGIRLEVQQALLALQTLRKNVATLSKEVDLAEENYRTLSEQARVGLATSLDVSTALNALAQARTELARQEFDLEVAKKELEAVTGTFASDFIRLED